MFGRRKSAEKRRAEILADLRMSLAAIGCPVDHLSDEELERVVLRLNQALRDSAQQVRVVADRLSVGMATLRSLGVKMPT